MTPWGTLKAIGKTCSRKRVAKLMKNHRLAAKMFKRFKGTTRQDEKSFFLSPDLLQQDFTTYEPNEAWVSDITYIPTQGG